MENNTGNETRKKNDKWSGSYRERKNGKWEGRISINGIKKSVHGKSESEVKKKIRIYRNVVATGCFEESNILLKDYINTWLQEEKFNDVKRYRLKRSTYDRLESTFINHIEKTIGKIPINKIKTSDIQKMIEDKIKPPIDSKIHALAPSSIDRITGLLFSCFKYAQENNHINYNPIIKLKLPGEEMYVTKTKKMRILTSEEMIRLKDVCLTKTKSDLYRYKSGLYILILLNTGLRIGELLALNYDDVSFENKLIKVTKTIESNVVNREPNGKNYIDIISSPKTKSSNRLVPLSDIAIFYIKEIIKENKSRGIITEFLASSNIGSRAKYSNVKRTLGLLCDMVDLEGVTLHSLRHTFCSTLIKCKEDLYIISPIMGHKNIKTTEEVYSYVLEEDRVKNMNMIDII